MSRSLFNRLKSRPSDTEGHSEADEFSEDDLIIAVMGPTGTGKSSFIAMATGEDMRVGHDLESCTASIQVVKYQYFDQTIVFVDTPGFDDTHKSDAEILSMIAQWLKKTYKRKITLAGIIYLHAIFHTRMGGTIYRNLEMFEKLCGKNALRNVVLATTMWTDVEETTGIRRQQQLERSYWKAMIDAGSTAFRYDNTFKSAWIILERILESAHEKQALQLQKELVDLHRQLKETAAGRKLYLDLEALIRVQSENVKRLRAQVERNPSSLSLDEEYAKLLEKNRHNIQELRMFRISLGERLGRRLASLFRADMRQVIQT